MFAVRVLSLGFSLCLVPGLLFGQEANAAKYRLRYQVTLGEKLHYKVTQKSSMLQKFAGNERLDSNEVHEQKYYRVTSVEPDGAIELEPFFEHVRMSAKFGKDGAPIEYDSAVDKEIPAPFRTVEGAVGRPRPRVSLTVEGRLLQIGGKQVTKRKGTKSVPVTDPVARQQILAYQNIMIAMPVEEVAVGDRWTELLLTQVEVAKDVQRDIQLLRSYKLNSVSEGIAEITFTTALHSPVRRPDQLMQLIQSKPSGVIRFDIDRGRIVSRTTVLEGQVFNPFGKNGMFDARTERVETLSAAPIASVPNANSVN